MINTLLIQTAKFVSKFSQTLNLGNGSTWPGHIALTYNQHIIEDLVSNSSMQVILVVGTNGKTTTSSILATILKEVKNKVIQNTSGANLLNGIASTLLLHTNTHDKLTANYGVFEVDENNLPLVLEHITPKVIIALNLFRDQLDRYGELDSIAKKWNKAFQSLPQTTTLVLNGDDPLIAYLAKDVVAKVVYVGLSEKEVHERKLSHAADSVYCPQCGNKLNYQKVFYSHLGVWECPNCHVKRPQIDLSESYYPLSGTYNKYNTLAAVLAAKQLSISEDFINTALHSVTPAFGRQEQLTINGKHIQIFLAKNPTSMNESLRTITELNKPSVLFVLNDRIPDGRDISWIWDISMEEYVDTFSTITISGDRTYDMSLRLAYSMQSPISNFQFPNKNTKYKIPDKKYVIEPNLKLAISRTLESLQPSETLYILPTYSAMLEVRKILTGRKIL